MSGPPTPCESAKLAQRGPPVAAVVVRSVPQSVQPCTSTPTARASNPPVSASLKKYQAFPGKGSEARSEDSSEGLSSPELSSLELFEMSILGTEIKL